MRSPRDLQRYGGLLCLDFLNTVDWRGLEEPEDYLESYADLLEWSALAGALGPDQGDRLRRVAGKGAAQSALARAVRFREAAYRISLALISGHTPESQDMLLVNAVIARARSRSVLQQGRGEFSWVLARAQNDVNLPLWIVALSFAELLTSGAFRNVRKCGGPECGWLFLDTTKNHQRRWCSMQGCGNRAKARRHYAKTR